MTKGTDWKAWRVAAGAVPQTALCAILGSTRKTVLEWQESGLPRHEDGTYDLAAVFAWVKEHYEGKVAGSGNSPALERFRSARAQQEEMRLARLRGELVETAVVQAEWRRIERILVDGLLGLPNRLAQHLAGLQDAPAVYRVLDESLRDLLVRSQLKVSVKAKPKAAAKKKRGRNRT